MTLGDSPCTLLVSPWLGEVVGASLALGKAMCQPLLALGAIWEVIRCSDGAPSAHRVSSRSLTCDTFFSKLNTRTPLYYGNHTATVLRLLYGCHTKAVRIGASFCIFSFEKNVSQHASLKSATDYLHGVPTRHRRSTV